MDKEAKKNVLRSIMKLDFNSQGFLVPNINIVTNLECFKATFVDELLISKTRVNLYENYLNYSNELKHLLQVDYLTQWINGSFVTKTINPKDIDLVTFIPEPIFSKKEKEIIDFKQRNWFDLKVDAYLIIERSNFGFESDKLYWLNQFSKTRKISRKGIRNDKGFIEISY